MHLTVSKVFVIVLLISTLSASDWLSLAVVDVYVSNTSQTIFSCVRSVPSTALFYN